MHWNESLEQIDPGTALHSSKSHFANLLYHNLRRFTNRVGIPTHEDIAGKAALSAPHLDIFAVLCYQLVGSQGVIHLMACFKVWGR
jgi:hypothetical protein